MSEFVEIRRKVCARSREWRAVLDMLDVDILVLAALLEW